MLLLDPFTLYFLLMATLLLLSLLLLLIGHIYRQERSLRLWGLSGLLGVGGVLLLMARDVLSPWLGVVAANSLLFCSLAGTWLGIAEFQQRPLPWRLAGLLCGGCSLLWVLLLFHGDTGLRALLYGPIYLLFAGLALHELFRQPQHWQRGSYRLVGAIILLLMLSYTYRTYFMLQHPVHNPLHNTGLPLQQLLASLLEFAKTLGLLYLVFERMQQRLQQLAMQDALTGLHNRRAFEQQATAALQHDGHHRHALLVMDLDLFKRINDGHGHQAGDAALQHFAGLLAAQLPAGSISGRLGGEEFVALLRDTSSSQAWQVAEAIRSQLAANWIGLPDKPVFQVTTSIGLAMRQHGQQTLAALYHDADMALYDAKQRGRNQVCSSQPLVAVPALA
ncbi:GGDEF domain-containing protein [Vogesella sp. GCM10023246]|uniref:diguanylate cyclase n=1 Tax=Vogesella oryzagri TaxID=3160864 RepID=A0ABV1M6Z4_9NEIS